MKLAATFSWHKIYHNDHSTIQPGKTLQVLVLSKLHHYVNQTYITLLYIHF